MLDFFIHLFDPSESPSSVRGNALSTTTGWLHLASDMAIFFAYAVICTLLMMFLYRQRNLPYRPTIWMLWLFMLACGITRLVGAAMLYYPAFRLLLVIKILTAIVSIVTVFAVARIFPTMLGLDAYSRSHRKSLEDAERHRLASEALSDQRDQLEQRATQLTVRDRRIRRSLESSGAAACSWDAGSNEILWEVGLKDMLAPASEDSASGQTWAQFLGPTECARILAASRGSIETGGELALEFAARSIHGGEGSFVLRAKPEPSTGNGRTVLTGLASFHPAPARVSSAG